MATINERWQFPLADSDDVFAVAINPGSDGILLGKKHADGSNIAESIAKLDWAALGALSLVINRTLENHRRAVNGWPLFPTNTQEIIDAMHLKGTRTV